MDFLGFGEACIRTELYQRELHFLRRRGAGSAASAQGGGSLGVATCGAATPKVTLGGKME